MRLCQVRGGMLGAGSWELGAERSLELLEVARWVGAVRKSGRTGSRGVGESGSSREGWRFKEAGSRRSRSLLAA